MIKVEGRSLLIPHSERELGYQGDNIVESRKFLITDKSLFDLSFKLDVEEPCAFIDLEKSVSDDGKARILTWKITSGITQNGGRLSVQLRAFDTESSLVWHSETESFFVRESINASSEIENVALTEFEQIEQRATQAKEEAQQQAILAKNYAQESKDTAEEIGNSLQNHIDDNKNPHNINASQVGAYSREETDILLTSKANSDHNHELAYYHPRSEGVAGGGANMDVSELFDVDGFMSASDKGKLDAIEPEANKTDIVQTTGDSEEAVMSQKAVTEQIGNIKTALDTKIDKPCVDVDLTSCGDDVEYSTTFNPSCPMYRFTVPNDGNTYTYQLYNELSEPKTIKIVLNRIMPRDFGAFNLVADGEVIYEKDEETSSELVEIIITISHFLIVNAQKGFFHMAIKEYIDGATKIDIVQTTGNSEEAVMSQKAVTDQISSINTVVNDKIDKVTTSIMDSYKADNYIYDIGEEIFTAETDSYGKPFFNESGSGAYEGVVANKVLDNLGKNILITYYPNNKNEPLVNIIGKIEYEPGTEILGYKYYQLAQCKGERKLLFNASFVIFNDEADETGHFAFIYPTLWSGSVSINLLENVDKVVRHSYVDEQIGNIETALDSIIAIQEELIGGESV